MIHTRASVLMWCVSVYNARVCMRACRLYVISPSANPVLSPELQAKATVVDFTVTMSGLEDQLLSRVVQHEQKTLEDQLRGVYTDITANTKALQELNDTLLKRLSQSQGNLLDDTTLMTVLADIKQRSITVQNKLKSASDTRTVLTEKRELYRPVAVVGSVLFFTIQDVSRVNAMYQTSLQQFMELFGRALTTSEPNATAKQRIVNIIHTATSVITTTIVRGLYNDHKLLFKFLYLLKLSSQYGLLPADVVMLVGSPAGASPPASGQSKPFGWLPGEVCLDADLSCHVGMIS